MPHKGNGRRVSLCIKMFSFTEQRMLLLDERLFTLSSIFTFTNVMDVSEIKLLKQSNLIHIIVKNANG